MPLRKLAVLAVVAVIASACARGDRDLALEQRSATTASTAAVETTTTPPTEAPPAPETPGGGSRAPRQTSPPAPRGPAPSCPPIPPRAAPRADRSKYDLRIDVRLAENAVVGDVNVRFTPDLATDRIIFRLWPNGPRPARGGARLDVGQVVLNGRPTASSQPDPTTLEVASGPLAAGRAVDVAVPWRLTLPGSINERMAREGDAVRLGSFFPILPWEPGVGWAREPPTTGFAEASMASNADFMATITVPEGLNVLATGLQNGNRWTAPNVSDFALSVGRFRLQSATAHVPDPVAVTVGVHDATGDSPSLYIGKIVRSLEDFSRRFGPYPWPAYTMAVTPDLGGGIEYPMHVMQGPGTSGRTTSHEVAHMWFFAFITNNQGRDPWMDEGLATYAEARFEHTESSFRNQSTPAGGKNRLGEPMTYWETRQSIYYRSVYGQGAQALLSLGPADMVDCALRVYAARNAYRIARPADLVSALEAVFPNARSTMAGFGVRT